MLNTSFGNPGFCIIATATGSTLTIDKIFFLAFSLNCILYSFFSVVSQN